MVTPTFDGGTVHVYTLFLTGGIGAGKSLAARHLEGRGARRVDLDALAHEVLREPAVKSALVERFGPQVLDGPAWDGARPCDADLVEPFEVDRAALAAVAFADPDATAALDAITHPRIMARLAEELCVGGSCTPSGPAAPLTVVEVPLLEASGRALADEVMAIRCPRARRLAHAVARGMAPEDFARRDEAQASDELRAALADVVVDNDADGPASLCARLDAWWEERAALGWRLPDELALGRPGAPLAPPPAVARPGLHSPAVAFVGRHNSGKTTLVEKLIAELVARGLDVGSVKHHGHRGFAIDVPGKDSWRHRQAGASEVAIASPDQFALVRSQDGDMTTEEIVAQMRPHDVVIVEGFRRSSLPTVEVMRAANPRDLACARAFAANVEAGHPFDARPDEELGRDGDRLPDARTVAVATDMPFVCRAVRSCGMHALALDDPAALASFVQDAIC